MIKRIIFDIDGTLIAGVDFSSYVSNALRRYNIIDSNKVKQFLSNIKEYEKVYNCYDKDSYLKFFSDKLNIKLDSIFLEIFFDELKKCVPKNSEKIKEVLISLKEYELVLLSNFFEESQRNRLQTMGINNYFSEYYGEKITKPNKEVYIDSAGRHEPSECLIIGDDKLLDVNIPRSLGFNTLFVNENGDIKSVEQITPMLIKKY